MLQQVAHVFGWVAVGWSGLIVCLALLTWWLRARMVRRLQAVDRSDLTAVRVLLVRPCAGDERHLRRCLESVGRARFSFRLEVVMAVDDESDRALPMARDVAAGLREAGLSCEAVVVPMRGPNRKVGILHEAVASRAYSVDVVLNADSNVDLEAYDLDRLVQPLVAAKGPGAIWAPHAVHADVGALGARASAAVLNGSLHCFALVSAIAPRGLVGKLFGVRMEALDAIDGFDALVEYVGEDLELSRRVRKAGYRVMPVAEVVRSFSGSRHIGETIARHARWMSVLRAQRPWMMPAFPLLLCGTPIMLTMSALVWPFSISLSAGGMGLCVLGRLLAARLARRASGFPTGLGTAVVDAVLADMVLLTALFRVVASREIHWRGMRLRLRSDGRIETS